MENRSTIEPTRPPPPPPPPPRPRPSSFAHAFGEIFVTQFRLWGGCGGLSPSQFIFSCHIIIITIIFESAGDVLHKKTSHRRQERQRKKKRERERVLSLKKTHTQQCNQQRMLFAQKNVRKRVSSLSKHTSIYCRQQASICTAQAVKQRRKYLQKTHINI